MRTIKFRGKCPSYKKNPDYAWVYGSLLTSGFFTTRKQYNIVDENNRIFYNALPETIGQFTGVYDIDGAEIFEGDIVEQFTLDLAYQQVGNYPPPNVEVEEWEIKREVNVVEFKGGSFCTGCMPIMLEDLFDNEEKNQIFRPTNNASRIYGKAMPTTYKTNTHILHGNTF